MALFEKDQKEHKKLGTVTYVDPDKSGQPISVKGITFAPNEAVNVDDLFTEDEAEAFKRDLAGNSHFKVEGGPDHRKILEARQKHEEEAEKKRAEAAEKAQQQAQRQQPPPDWKGPDNAHLEHDRGAHEASMRCHGNPRGAHREDLKSPRGLAGRSRSAARGLSRGR